MKVQVSEATPTQLNWLVAKAMGLLAAGRVVVDFKYMSGEAPVRWEPQLDTYYSSAYSPSTNWAHGGPIIEWEKISIQELEGIWSAFFRDKLFEDDNSECWQDGPTPLIAAMRCYVASKLGDEVEVPDDLVWDELIYEKGEEE